MNISHVKDPGFYRGLSLTNLHQPECVNDVIFPAGYVIPVNDKEGIFTYSLKHTFMPILTILITLVIAGVILWLVNTYIPMDQKIKNILNVLVVIIVIIWLLKAFGVLSSLKI